MCKISHAPGKEEVVCFAGYELLHPWIGHQPIEKSNKSNQFFQIFRSIATNISQLLSIWFIWFLLAYQSSWIFRMEAIFRFFSIFSIQWLPSWRGEPRSPLIPWFPIRISPGAYARCGIEAMCREVAAVHVGSIHSFWRIVGMDHCTDFADLMGIYRHL